MNIYSFTHHLEQWLQKHRGNSETPSQKLSYNQAIPKSKSKALQYINKAKPPFMFALIVLSFTGVLGNRFYNQPKITEGTKAQRTFIAPSYLTIVDVEETEKLRKQARDASIPVLKKDIEITNTIINNTQDYLNKIRDFRKSVGRFPFLAAIEIISLESQLYLRECSEEEWLNILRQVDNHQESVNTNLDIYSEEYPDFNLQREQIIAKLQYFQKKMKPEEYQKILQKIKQARRQYHRAWQEFSQDQSLQMNDEEKRMALELTDENWEKTELIIRIITRRIVTQGISQGIPEDLIQQTINVNLGIEIDKATPELIREEIPERAKSIASSIIFKFIKPNLIIDAEETARRAERAAETIPEQLIYVKKDEIIIEKNEEITHQQFLKLDEFGLSRRGVNYQGLIMSGAIAVGAVTIVWISQKKSGRNFRCRDQLLLCLLSLSSPVLAIAQIPYTSLPAVGLLSGSFYGPTVGVTQVAVSAVLTIFADEISQGEDWKPLVVGIMGGLLGAAVAGKLRDRDQLAQLGVAVGLTQWLLYVIIGLILTASPQSIWLVLVQQAIYHGLLPGLGWSVFALGISPYLERLFDLLTPIRLAELSNINQPLLKKLAEDAPGTWQHTLFVSSLAEGAARKLSCNIELTRAGTLYHDIGKLHDPLGFIENQMGGPNKHDEINDPWQSTIIIKKHVSHGLVMARRYELPRAIADFIPQHQGTMLIAYFYFQAKKQAEENGEADVPESYFRYDGPIPQTREAGIMMLADSCEAALRSLDNATKETALIMISKILKARWQDNQLVDSGLKYEELATIAQVFVDVWEQSKHRRIAYPKSALEIPAISISKQKNG